MTYGTVRCDAAHSAFYTSPPFATVDLGRHRRVVGVPGWSRYICDHHARGLRGWRGKLRMAGAPDVIDNPTPEEDALNRPEVTEDSIEGAMQRNDALRVLHLALASNGYDLPMSAVGSVLRDIEEGGYTMRLTTSAERTAKNNLGKSA